MVADAVSNMRSALDNVAYELAHHHVGEMDAKQKVATEFPICINEVAFRRFFRQGERGRLRGGLYGDLERKALECVQPFALSEEARVHGVERSTPLEDDLLMDEIYALNVLWNIDKHRRLPELAWALRFVFWPGDDAGPAYRWVGNVRELTPLQDDTVLGELRGLPGAGRRQMNPRPEVDLVLTDDPSPYGSPLVARLERLHQTLTGWV